MQLTIKSTLQKLVSGSNVLSGFRVLLAMSFTFIPSALSLQLPFFEQSPLQISISLCLGVMASAIVEVDDNTRGRLKFIGFILSSFFISASFIEILMPYPLFFALGLFLSSFLFLMLPIYGGHYRKIGFGTLLIAIYTMIGHIDGVIWYEQPLLLTLGALWYGIFSIVWNIFNPHNSLKEQLSQIYFAISRYQMQKSALFNECEGRTKTGRFNIRQQLAIRNVPIITRITSTKLLIQLHSKSTQQQQKLQRFNQMLSIAEQIHEKVSASQFLYSRLESTFGNSQILEGYYQLFTQMSHDCHQLGQAINSDAPYQHSRQLKWIMHALADQLTLLDDRRQKNRSDQEAMLGLKAIFDNLSEVNKLLLLASEIEQSEPPEIIGNKQKTLANIKIKSLFNQAWRTFTKALTPTNDTFKHATRVSTCMLIAYSIQQGLDLTQGFWLLLTVLFVCQPSFSETRKRFVQRTIGTLAGIAIAYPLILFVDSIALQISFLVLSAFLFFCYLRTNYGLSVVFITVFVVFVFNLLTGTGVEILPSRIIETLFGSALSFLAITVIFPEWQFSRVPSLVQKLLGLSSGYFLEVVNQYQSGVCTTEKFNTARLSTFQANATLTTAWQSMLFEPKSKQILNKEIYALVNRTDALVSYISALSSHRHYIEQFESNFKLKKLVDLTAQQITLANQSHKNQDCITSIISDDDFEKCKIDQNGEVLLIIEQLRLIAFTAIDIQALLNAVNTAYTIKREKHVIE